jgi:hypothetical protein
MFKNAVKITIRNLVKNKTFSFVNIIGLAVGMASFMLITLWIQNELRVEAFHENKDRLYRVFTNLKEEGKITTGNTTPVPLAENLKSDFAEVAHVSRTSWLTLHLFKVGDKKLTSAGIFVEPDFLQMFSFPLLKGSTTSALQDINSILLTEDFAKALFGEQDPMGKIITMDNRDNFKVTGILKNVPGNTSFFFRYLMPYSYFRKTMEWAENNWAANSIHTYVELKPGIALEQIQHKIKDLPKQHGEKNFEMFFHPMTKWHLYSDCENGVAAGGRIGLVRFFSVIAGMILLIACINFVNLSTAASNKRAREIGVRKVLGVRRKSLVFQFLLEAVLLSFLAGLVAILIAFQALPLFNELFSSDFKIDITDSFFWLSFLAFILFTGVAAGLYPAFYLSSFKPVFVLKGLSRKIGGSFSFHRVLVVTQFTFCVVLIIGSIIIRKQTNHVQNRDSGYDRDKLIYVQFFGDLKKNYALVKSDLLNIGLASSVTQTNSPITEIWDRTSKLEWAGKNPDLTLNFNVLCADEDIKKTFGVELVTGRELDLQKFSTDSTSCLLSESAAKLMGFENPLGQIIRSDDIDWKVVGVIKDVIIESPYRTTDPLIVYGAKSWFNMSILNLAMQCPLPKTCAK